ncbi:predicted protein [Streptomyces sp. AA4]|nr:predicted protein [Streptomyces sp. AA4]
MALTRARAWIGRWFAGKIRAFARWLDKFLPSSAATPRLDWLGHAGSQARRGLHRNEPLAIIQAWCRLAGKIRALRQSPPA